MSIMLLVFAIILSLYIANVISCSIICEVYEEAQIAKNYVFIMPIVVVLVLFCFLFSDIDWEIDCELTRLQLAVSYIFFPGKNVAVVECFAAACKENTRKLAFKSDNRNNSIPRVRSCADFFGDKILNLYSAQ